MVKLKASYSPVVNLKPEVLTIPGRLIPAKRPMTSGKGMFSPTLNSGPFRARMNA